MTSLISRAALAYMEHVIRDTMVSVYSTPRRVLHPDPAASILDLGCHNGVFALSIGRSAGTSHVYGVEYNRGLAAMASDNGVKATVADLNAGIPLASESMDVVTAFNVLEHLVETRRFLEEIYRVLHSGGVTIIDTPNLASWHNIAALLVGLQPFSGPNITSMIDSEVSIVRRMNRRAHQLPESSLPVEAKEAERYRHIVVVAFRSLISILQRIGFEIVEARGHGYYPLPSPAAKVLSRLDPWHAHHSVVVARRPR